MASAGYCTSCGRNVYLTAGGGCPQGHGPDAIQGVYEVPDPIALPSTGAAGQPQTKSKALLIAAIVVAVCLAIGCGVLSLLSISIPVFNSASENAEERACFAYQRVIEGAAQQMYAADGTYPSAITDLVDAGYLMEAPACPSGGEYVYSPTDATVECSLHGHYE